MASLLPNAEQQFVDGNGVPYALGYVYFYEPGTTYPKDTWQDVELQTLNTNPVILNSAGRAVIYGIGAYRQILKDADGNTVWDKETADLTTASVTGGPASVLSATTSTPPASPSVGDAYIIPVGATGVWSSHDADVATWTNASAWNFETPAQGWQTYISDSGDYAIFNGTAWETMMAVTDWSIATRIVDNFAGVPQVNPDMTVLVDPGAILNGSTLTQVGARLAGRLVAADTNVYDLPSVTGLITGQAVRGQGIAPNTTITVSGSTVTLSVAATETLAQTALVFSQVTGTISAPVTNPRIDRVVVDQATGLVSVATGTEDANPVPPSLPVGKYPVCQVRLETSTTAITRGDLLDERAWTYQVSNSYPGSETSISSASTCDLGSAGSYIVEITGTTNISSFGSSASATNPLYFVRFSGALTISYNGTSLLTPGSANIVTSAGDTATLQYLDSGNWKILSYQKANGQTLSMTGATVSVASATTCDIGSAKSNSVLITGTTTITGFGSSASTSNPIYFLRFSGALTLTYNATSLIIPGAASITTGAGDAATAEYLGSGNWRVLSYSKAASVPTTTVNPTVYDSGTFTAAASHTITLSSTTYKVNQLIIYDVDCGTSGADINYQFTDGGVTVSAGYKWTLRTELSTGATNLYANNSDSSATFQKITGLGGSGAGSVATITIRPYSSQNYVFADVAGSYLDTSSRLRSTTGGAFVSSVATLDGIVISASSGTVAFSYRLVGYS